MRVVFYERVSVDGRKVPEVSHSVQLSKARELIERLGGDVIDVYLETGATCAFTRDHHGRVLRRLVRVKIAVADGCWRAVRKATRRGRRS
jgi:hypothetical protein